MRLLFASDSFKGTLTSEQTISLLKKAAGEVFGECSCAGVIVADGGEGTTDAVLSASGGQRVTLTVHDPHMCQINAYYGKTDEKTAVMEMAAASGLTLIPEDARNPLKATSYGTGEMIRDALDKGFQNIYIAIGGSATNDGGIGCIRALGARLLDADGNELEGFGEDLEKLARIDVSGLDARIKKTNITIMCDVNNPLCGENGATYTFGAQKGGSPEILNRLEEGMIRYRDLMRRDFGIDPDELAGGGAAGGLGTALMVFLGGKLQSGIEAVLDLIGFDKMLAQTDLVVTGEGRTDWQSCFGKVMQGVGEHCKKAGVPAVGLSGSLGEGAEQIFSHGIQSLMTTVDAPMELSEAFERAEELYYKGAVRMFRFIRTGMELSVM